MAVKIEIINPDRFIFDELFNGPARVENIGEQGLGR